MLIFLFSSLALARRSLWKLSGTIASYYNNLKRISSAFAVNYVPSGTLAMVVIIRFSQNGQFHGTSLMMMANVGPQAQDEWSFMTSQDIRMVFS